MEPNEEGAPPRRLAARGDRQGRLSPGPGRVSLALTWLGCSLLGPLALLGLWAAPVMQMMDALRLGQPKADWVLALHAVSLRVVLLGLAILLGTAALCLFRDRLQLAQRLLVAGMASLLGVSLAVLLLVWL